MGPPARAVAAAAAPLQVQMQMESTQCGSSAQCARVIGWIARSKGQRAGSVGSTLVPWLLRACGNSALRWYGAALRCVALRCAALRGLLRGARLGKAIVRACACGDHEFTEWADRRSLERRRTETDREIGISIDSIRSARIIRQRVGAHPLQTGGRDKDKREYD